MSKLRIAENLSLPADTVTSTLIVYGGKGMGKTVLGAVMCEELDATSHRFSVIDPMGVFWGLRHSADGKGPGIEVLILGGKYGDMPIEPTGGAVVADLVADESINVVIDISRRADGKMWGRGERIRFVADYCTRLYERQGERRRPLLQIIDEAGRFAPEQIRKGQEDAARSLGALESLVEEARNVGVGVMLITQRSARMNKSVSELADAMFAFRTVGPRSVDAILDWFGEHVPKEHWKELIEQLRKLPRGTALVVSPGWLEFEGQAVIRMRHTFDSSATPKTGKEQRASGPGARPDLSRYAERMAATIEKANADNPKELRRKIAELEREVKKAGTAAPSDAAVKAAYREGYERGAREGAEVEGERLAGALLPMVEHIRGKLDNVEAAIKNAAKHAHRPAIPASAARPTPPPPPPTKPEPRRPPEGVTGNGSVGNSGLRRMLIALAQRPQGLTARQLGVRAGMSSKSGTFDTYLSKARSQGWIQGSRDLMVITAEGATALGSYQPLPTGHALLEYWLAQLSGGAKRMLYELARAYPAELDVEELGKRANISSVSGTFDTYLSRLKSLELVEGGRGNLRASGELF